MRKSLYVSPGSDLDDLGQSWLDHPNVWQLGDFNADGTIDAGDLNKIGQNWLMSIPVTAVAESVPEPTAMVLWAFGLGAIAWKFRSAVPTQFTRNEAQSTCDTF